MKLTERMKSKLRKVNFTSVAFFAVSVISITFAWLAYSNTIATNLDVDIKRWDINITTGNTEITNEYDINVDSFYPGMDDYSDSFTIRNNGDLAAKIDYNISYFRLFDQEIPTNNLTFYELQRDYPFKISLDYDTRYLGINDTATFSISCEWPLDSGDDAADTLYGNMASEFYAQEQQIKANNPSYEIRKGLELKIEIVVSQYIDETNSFATDSWDTIQLAVEKGDTSKYSVGATKNVRVGNKNLKVKIVNKSAPTSCNGDSFSQTACGFVLEFENVIEEKKMNSSNTSNGGWPNSELYEYLHGDFFSTKLPYELRKVVATTRVVSGHNSNETTNYVTYDKLYLFSNKEYYGVNAQDTAANSTRQIDWYVGMSSTPIYDSGSLVGYAYLKMKKLDSLNNPKTYWFRSVNGTQWFDAVHSSSIYSPKEANEPNVWFAPAFRIT